MHEFFMLSNDCIHRHQHTRLINLHLLCVCFEAFLVGLLDLCCTPILHEYFINNSEKCESFLGEKMFKVDMMKFAC